MYCDRFEYDAATTLDASGNWGDGADDWTVQTGGGVQPTPPLAASNRLLEGITCLYGRSIAHRNHTALLRFRTPYSSCECGVVLRGNPDSPNDYYFAIFSFHGGVDPAQLRIGKCVAGVRTILASIAVGYYGMGDYDLEASVCGELLSARVKLASQEWTSDFLTTAYLFARDSDIADGFYAGIYAEGTYHGAGIYRYPTVLNFVQSCSNDRVFLVVDEASGVSYPAVEIIPGEGEILNRVHGVQHAQMYDTQDLGDGIMRLGDCDSACQAACQSDGCQTACQETCELACRTGCEVGGCEGACTAGCELGCETPCEAGCQQACQVTCITGCQVMCQSLCETACETACQDTCETVCQGGCTTSCEMSCQDFCEMICQDGCEFACEQTCEQTCEMGCEGICQTLCMSGCESECLITCQIVCQQDCQTACEAGCEANCEWGCEATCQESCEVECMGGCQTECELGCETACESACQEACQLGCQTPCQLACESPCESACEAACEAACQTECELGCETGCEVGCQEACELGCQTECELGCETGCEVSCETTCESAYEINPAKWYCIEWQRYNSEAKCLAGTEYYLHGYYCVVGSDVLSRLSCYYIGPFAWGPWGKYVLSTFTAYDTEAACQAAGCP